MNGSRSIEIGRDAAGNTIITGDGNVVVIEAVQRLAEPPAPVTALGPNPTRASRPSIRATPSASSAGRR